METSLSAAVHQDLASSMCAADDAFRMHYPGAPTSRQPVHTIYGGAHLFKATTISRLGTLASEALLQYAPDYMYFWKALELEGFETLPQNPSDHAALLAEEPSHNPASPHWLHRSVYDRIVEKIHSEPVEDFRIDFEDGFGNRPDKEEDQVAFEAANALAQAHGDGGLSPYIGIRIKPFNRQVGARGLRTLDIFVSQLSKALGGRLPENFLVTLPKVEYPEQIQIFCKALNQLEAKLRIPKISMEIMIETTNAILGPEGKVALKSFVDQCEGRCFAAHFGTYDYTASSDLISSEQTMDNPVCDFARHHMKAALAHTGVHLSDGATNIMPVGPHKDIAGIASLQAENCRHVHQAWRLSYAHIQNSLRTGIYQGWDLHPAQIPIRYASVYYFFRRQLNQTTQRLQNFLQVAAKATLSGNVFDDAATGQGLLNFFIRAWECRAISAEELAKTGLTADNLKLRNFPKILAAAAHAKCKN